MSPTIDHLMRATGLMLVHGLGLGKSEAHAASDDEGFDPVEYERTHNLGATGYLRRRATKKTIKPKKPRVSSKPAGKGRGEAQQGPAQRLVARLLRGNALVPPKAGPRTSLALAGS